MLREILEKLIQREFICEVSNPRALAELRKESVQKYVNDALLPYGRELTNQDNELFYASYTEDLTAKDRREIKASLEHTRDSVAPIIFFLTFVMRVNDSDVTLQAGDILKQLDLLYRIENKSILEEELKKIVSYKIFKTVKAGASNAERLEAILTGVEKLGYIKLDNPDSRIYRVTGKINYYHQIIDFIVENESILLDEEIDSSEQQDLFS